MPSGLYLPLASQFMSVPERTSIRGRNWNELAVQAPTRSLGPRSKTAGGPIHTTEPSGWVDWMPATPRLTVHALPVPAGLTLATAVMYSRSIRSEEHTSELQSL